MPEYVKVLRSRRPDLDFIFSIAHPPQVAGFELQRHYGRAFDKVVQAIKTEILPILLPKSVVSWS